MIRSLALGFVGGSVLGLVRDASAIRVLGFGATSDDFFVMLTLVVAFFGIGGQATYLPIAMQRPRFAAVFLWCAAAVMAALAVIVVRPRDPTQTFAVALLFPLMASVLPRLKVLVLRRHAGRLGAIPLIANIVFLLGLALYSTVFVRRDGLLMGCSYGLALAVALIIVCPRVESTRSHERNRSGGAAMVPFLAVSLSLQVYPLVERVVAQTIGVGLNTLLAVGGKLASLPIGVIGYAVGTAAFIRLASRTNPDHYLSWTRRLEALNARQLAKLTLALLGVGVVLLLATVLGVSLVGPLLGLPSSITLSERGLVAAYMAAVPFALVFSISTQELQATGDFLRYSVVTAAFMGAYLFTALGAFLLGSGLVLVAASILAFFSGFVALVATSNLRGKASDAP